MSEFFEAQPQREAPGDWDPFGPRRAEAARRQQAELAEQRRARLADTAAVFGTPHGRAWLERRAQAELAAPSYQPGDTFELVSWREGRKALLRELLNELDEATRPSAAETED